MRAFVQNLLDIRTTEQVLKEDTYIKAARFDWKNESKPLPGMGADSVARKMPPRRSTTPPPATAPS